MELFGPDFVAQVDTYVDKECEGIRIKLDRAIRRPSINPWTLSREYEVSLNELLKGEMKSMLTP
jgi:hypothetical protein